MLSGTNEPPQFSDGEMGYWWSIAEDTAIGTVVGTVSASDPEGDPITYALTSGTDVFSIDSSTGAISLIVGLDYETSQYASFGVSATDPDGNTATSWGDISVTDVNESPVFDDDWGMGYWWNVAEDTAIGSVIGTVSATDPQGDSVSYGLTSGSETFAIDSETGEITLISPLDYETSQYASFGVSATDTDGNIATSWGDISVTDVNESPVFDDDWGMGYWWNVAEDTAVGTVVGTVSASDPQGDEVSYALTSGSETFAIDSMTGEISLIAELDYETSQYASFGVRATDTDGNSTTSWGDISVTDVNEAPVFSEGEMGYWWSLPEDASLGTLIGMVSANDPQGDEVTYQLTSGGSIFSIDSVSGELTLVAPLDYESSQYASFGVSATDPDGNVTTVWGQLSVLDVSESPSFGENEMGYWWNVAEDTPVGTVVGTVTANDPQGDEVTYQLTSGSSILSVDTLTGEITLVSPLDYETSQFVSFGVQASDSEGNVTSTWGEIYVDDVSEAPVFDEREMGYWWTFSEATAVGTLLGTVSATDPQGDEVTYQLTSGTSRFAIDSQSGAITLIASLDFETNQYEYFGVQAMDSDGNTTSAWGEVYVEDAAESSGSGSSSGSGTSSGSGSTSGSGEASGSGSSSGSGSGEASSSGSMSGSNAAPFFSEGDMGYWWTVSEDTPVGTVIGTVAATDPDGDSVSYELTSGTTYLSIDSETGAISLLSALDYESSQFISFGVRAVDSYGNSATTWGEISIEDVNESPVFDDDWGMGYWWNVAEDTPVGTIVGTVSASDPQGDTISYALTSGSETFSIDSVSGSRIGKSE